MRLFKKKSKYIDEETEELSNFHKLVISICLIGLMLWLCIFITNKVEERDIKMQDIEYVKESY